MSQIDLILLHPPSVYDFRERAILYGPISDLIPSSPVFEMYPLGFLTMTSYLEERGLIVRIVNLALRIINDRQSDVPAFLAKSIVNSWSSLPGNKYYTTRRSRCSKGRSMPSVSRQSVTRESYFGNAIW